MPTLSFLWHLHQPAYRTGDGLAHAPWVALHAGGAYTTLAHAIEECAARGHVVNIVPTLLEQLVAYRDGAVRDPFIDLLGMPPEELDDRQRRTLLQWAHHVTPRQLERSPRYDELLELAARDSESIDTGRLRDLQVLFIILYAGDQAWRDPRLAKISSKGRNFDTSEHERVIEWLHAQPGELMERWRRLADIPGVEISTCPYAHPILPLLIDTDIVGASWAPAAAPSVPRFRRPEDARRQLELGLEYMRSHGFRPVGCWPPEGSVSEDAVAMYGESGVRWLVTDQGILERSLDPPIAADDAADLLYRSWRLDGSRPALFFRDRILSDRIGFELGHRQDEEQAADEMLRHIRDLARRLPPEAAIVIALDGENPWLHYPQAGGTFLRRLMTGLQESDVGVEPVPLAEVAERSPTSTLSRLHPGSWIGATFATWIGDPEKTAAWRLLAETRDAVGETASSSMLLAEGSDWFWWLGDDNPTDLAPLYDRIFRTHLRDACRQAGIDPPVDLEAPLRP